MDENFDFSGAVDKFREMFSGEEGKEQLRGILEMFQSEPQNKPPEENEGGGFDFDPSMLFKIQKILSAANNKEQNERAKLLISLKPFLGKDRRDKVDKAVQLMNMSKVLSVFKEM